MKGIIFLVAALPMLLCCGGRTGLFGSPLDVADNGSDGAAVDAGTRDSALDGGNCAPGETQCKGVCTSGPCPVTLAKGYPLGIAADSTSVYWTNGANCDNDNYANIVKAPLAGGSMITLWTEGRGGDEPYALAVDAKSVYWTTGQSGVAKVPLAGGRATTLVPGSGWTNANPPYPPYARSDIALDDANVYWAVAMSCKDSGGSMNMEGAVLSVPLDGGVPTTLASGRGLSGGIAVDRMNVYWTTQDNLLKRPLAGGAPTTLAALGGPTFHLALDGASVYWLASTGLRKVAIDGGSIETLVSGAMMSGISLAPFAFALDGSNLYWSAGRSGTDELELMKMPSSGGVPSTLVAGLTEVDFFAFTATSVYWTEPVPGIVARLTPK